MEVPTTADYIIVGGGLTGCALAARLAELLRLQNKESLSILLLEAGLDPSSNLNTTSPMAGFALQGSELDWSYRTAPIPTTANRVLTLSAGKTLGGGSVLNYGGWTRGDASDYDAWARIVGDERWSYNGLLPYFQRSERFGNSAEADPQQHGMNGPMKVIGIHGSDPKRRYPLRETLHQAWAEMGVEQVPSGAGKLAGLSEFLENWDNGVRQPSHLAYNLAGSGVDVQTETPVERVLFETIEDQSLRAIGVLLVDGRYIHARKEVLLSAGALRSPQLLQLSGVATPILQKALAEDGGILDAQELGKNGRTHVETMILYHPLAPGVPVDGNHIATSVMLTLPTSRGTVRLASASPDDAPLIEPNYFSTSMDRAALVHGIRRLLNCLTRTTAGKDVIESEMAPAPGMKSLTVESTDDEIEDRIRSIGNVHWHSAGTCALGTVLDTELRVKGVQGLRVVDTSVFPAPIGGHPQATLYGLAERAASMIAEEGPI